MGIRLAEFESYFQQTKPLLVKGSVGRDLTSTFTLVVSDLRQLSEEQLLLSSEAGEILLYEEEISRVGLPKDNRSLSLTMDGGTKLTFTPLVPAGL